MFADRLPTLLVVVLHVLPPAVFAIVHGSVLYRLKGILVFALTCLCIGTVTESLSLRTGFPFGHYHFTEVMGPKFLGLPLLLVLAYLGIGYCSWVLGILILGMCGRPVAGYRTFALPVVASFIMLAWDLSMEPDWSTVDRAWIWLDGGQYFGVPFSNFFGWYLTAYLFFQTFAFYCRARRAQSTPISSHYWRMPILMYGICAAGNLLILRLPMAPPIVSDATGRGWVTMNVLIADGLVSLFIMGPIAVTAWTRLRKCEATIVAS
jgi:putative membrane protein